MVETIIEAEYRRRLVVWKNDLGKARVRLRPVCISVCISITRSVFALLFACFAIAHPLAADDRGGNMKILLTLLGIAAVVGCSERYDSATREQMSQQEAPAASASAQTAATQIVPSDPGSMTLAGIVAAWSSGPPATPPAQTAQTESQRLAMLNKQREDMRALIASQRDATPARAIRHPTRPDSAARRPGDNVGLRAGDSASRSPADPWRPQQATVPVPGSPNGARMDLDQHARFVARLQELHAQSALNGPQPGLGPSRAGSDTALANRDGNRAGGYTTGTTGSQSVDNAARPVTNR